MAGVERGCVAEVIVETANGLGLRGSGYRVATTAVLTAAHVVVDATSIRLRFNAELADEWTAEATVRVINIRADVAVLTFTAPFSDGIAPALFGHISERAAVVQCSAVGFPRFKLRSYGTANAQERQAYQLYRDSHQASGTISSLSNWREGSLEILVSPPAEDSDGASPWEGMSGAAVWCNGRIVGVVSRHYPSDGLNRLTAYRVERWIQYLSAADLALLHQLIDFPEHLADLDDVTPRDLNDIVLSDYIAQVEAIAPSNLLDRDRELTDIVGFCAGDQPYQWWQAEPWAGKSALAAWIVLHPPIGVRPVSFFVTGRLVGQADSAAFTDALIQQLAVVAGESTTLAVTPAAREGQRRRLLMQAAARLRGRGERLLLVIDGLDEDRGGPPEGPSSIAQLLPEDVPSNVRVLITSRPHPGLPDDVAAGHPLRTCTVRSLTPSPYARNLETEANRELNLYLYGNDPLKIDIIAFIAAAGGLTLRELSELTGARKTEVESRLRSVFGRILQARPVSGVPSRHADQAYLFAHETLKEVAERQLASEVDEYRSRIHEWGRRYHDLDWPESTPVYLLRSYAQLLSIANDLPRLANLATDRVRHDLMLKRTLDDVSGFLEIIEAQRLSTLTDRPDVKALALLAIEWERLTNRNQAIPNTLPSLWARLGQPERGQALAQTITDPNRRAAAFAKLASALANGGDVDGAKQVIGHGEHAARGITNHQERSRELVEIVVALGTLGDLEHMEQVARSITHPWYGAEAVSRLAVKVASLGHIERAESIALDTKEMARGVAGDWWLAKTLIDIVARLAKEDLTDGAIRVARAAERCARNLTRPEECALALASLAIALAGTDPTAANRLASEAETLAAAVGDSRRLGVLLPPVAAALASVGRLDRAERFARRHPIPLQQVKALAEISTVLAQIGQASDAQKVSIAAESVARNLNNEAYRAYALGWAAVSLVAAGQLGRAFSVTDDIRTQKQRLDVLSWTANALLKYGHNGGAEEVVQEIERVARNVGGTWYRAETLHHVICALIDAGHLGRAEDLLGLIDAPNAQANALRTVTVAWAEVGHVDQAERLLGSVASEERGEVLIEVASALAITGRVTEAEALARSLADPADRDDALALVAGTLARAGHAGAAERIASGLGRAARDEGLSEIAVALAKAGRTRRAERVAGRISSRIWRSTSLLTLVIALVKEGRIKHAEHVARDIRDRGDRAEALARVSAGLAKMGHAKRAEALANEIHDSSWQEIALAALAENLAKAGRRREACRIAASIGSLTWRAEALTRVAVVLVSDGHLRQAEFIVDSIDDRGDRAEALARTAIALGSAGDTDNATRLIRGITTSKERVHAYGRVAVLLARAGQRSKAVQFARSATAAASGMDDPTEQALMLERIARGIAKAGHVDLAERIAMNISASQAQVRTLLYVANRCMRLSPSSSHAHRICGVVLRGSSWYEALPLASRLDVSCPEAVAERIFQDRHASVLVDDEEGAHSGLD